MRGMTAICGKQRLRRLLPLFDLTDDGQANDQRGDATLHGCLPESETDGDASLYPFWVRFQENLEHTYS